MRAAPNRRITSGWRGRWRPVRRLSRFARNTQSSACVDHARWAGWQSVYSPFPLAARDRKSGYWDPSRRQPHSNQSLSRRARSSSSKAERLLHRVRRGPSCRRAARRPRCGVSRYIRSRLCRSISQISTTGRPSHLHALAHRGMLPADRLYTAPARAASKFPFLLVDHPTPRSPRRRSPGGRTARVQPSPGEQVPSGTALSVPPGPPSERHRVSRVQGIVEIRHLPCRSCRRAQRDDAAPRARPRRRGRPAASPPPPRNTPDRRLHRCPACRRW